MQAGSVAAWQRNAPTGEVTPYGKWVQVCCEPKFPITRAASRYT